MMNNMNINFNGANRTYSYKDIENLAKYATGVAITNKDEISAGEVLSYPAVPLAVQGMGWLKDNRKDIKGGLNAVKADSLALSNLRKTSGVKGVLASSSAKDLLGVIPKGEELAKLSSETQGLYESARKAAELAKGGSASAIKEAQGLYNQAYAAAAKETAASATGVFAKIKNVLGITKLGNAINSLAVKFPVLGKGINAFRAEGGGAMLALEGGVEVVSNVAPTFSKLGVKKGLKQVGKSTVKIAASVGGWVAGAALGAKAGALIGSIVPGAGTAIGAVAGAIIGVGTKLICGSLLSRLAKKGAQEIVGDDELEIAKKEQAEKLAQEAMNNSTIRNDLINFAGMKLEQEGLIDADSSIAQDALASIQMTQTSQKSNVTNPFVNNLPFQMELAGVPNQGGKGYTSQTAQRILG